jgi:hypothetical protein
VIAPGDPAIHSPLGLAKEDVDARTRKNVIRVPGHDDWNPRTRYPAIRGRWIG